MASISTATASGCEHPSGLNAHAAHARLRGVGQALHHRGFPQERVQVACTRKEAHATAVRVHGQQVKAQTAARGRQLFDKSLSALFIMTLRKPPPPT